MAAAAGAGAGEAPAGDFVFSPEKVAEIEQLNGSDAFEPVLGTTYLPVSFAWWAAFQARCNGNETSYVAMEIDNDHLKSERNALLISMDAVSTLVPRNPGKLDAVRRGQQPRAA